MTQKDMLAGVHKDLVNTLAEAKKLIDIPGFTFKVTEGIRTLDKQKMLFDAGKSKTMKSRHLTGHAVDLAVFIDGKLTWDYQQYVILSNFVKAAAEKIKVPIEWGGDWVTFKDGVHFQLSRLLYA